MIGRDRVRLAPCASSETRSSGDLGDSSLDYDGVEAGQGSCPSLLSSGSQVRLYGFSLSFSFFSNDDFILDSRSIVTLFHVLAPAI